MLGEAAAITHQAPKILATTLIVTHVPVFVDTVKRISRWQWRTEGGGLGGSNPHPPKFRRYRWSPRSHEQEEPASRFPFVVHCVLIRL